MGKKNRLGQLMTQNDPGPSGILCTDFTTFKKTLLQIILCISQLYCRWRQLISRRIWNMQLFCPLHLNNLKNSFRTFTNIAPVRGIGCSRHRPLISIILQAFTWAFQSRSIQGLHFCKHRVPE